MTGAEILGIALSGSWLALIWVTAKYADLRDENHQLRYALRHTKERHAALTASWSAYIRGKAAR